MKNVPDVRIPKEGLSTTVRTSTGRDRLNPQPINRLADMSRQGSCMAQAVEDLAADHPGHNSYIGNAFGHTAGACVSECRRGWRGRDWPGRNVGLIGRLRTTARIGTSASSMSRWQSATAVPTRSSGPSAQRSMQQVKARNPRRWSKEIPDWSPVGAVHLNPEKQPRDSNSQRGLRP